VDQSGTAETLPRLSILVAFGICFQTETLAEGRMLALSLPSLKIRHWIIALSLFAFVLLCVGGFWLARAIAEVPRDAYAMWATGELVCQHLRMNSNTWPKGWEDLEVTYAASRAIQIKEETNTTPQGTVISLDVFLPATFPEITNRVNVDWNADVNQLRLTPLPESGRPFEVITLRRGGIRSWEGKEPNRMVWEYLRKLPSVPNGE
jgi:hypothetical protein